MQVLNQTKLQCPVSTRFRLQAYGHLQDNYSEYYREVLWSLYSSKTHHNRVVL